ncbi:GNAT family N-acetyltransferase [Flavobacteriales bacterium]|nr:GNAT family N-acetyltransferase [Flavobacteriales bacterium]
MALAIRHEVFVIGQNCPEDLEYEFEEESTHFLVILKNKAVATARHRKTGKGYKLERFAVVKKERGKGYGNVVLTAILNDLKDYSGLIYMHAQEDVLPFYEKLGFKKEGDLFEEAGIMHYKMKLCKH